jgi:SAM-dependent methyltransferase
MENRRLFPNAVFEALTAYRQTAALKGAIELDLFTAVGEGNETVAALARRCQASERGVRMLCDFMVVLGFLEKQDQQYSLTPTAAAFLDRRSPTYMGTLSGFLNSPMISSGFADVAAAVRKGGTVIDRQGTVGPQHPVWVEFARSMEPRAALSAELLFDLLDLDPARAWKALDIAAGHGRFGIALAQRCPRATVVALDWPNVLTVAEENARAAGVGDRFDSLPGDAFSTEFGVGYDLVLLMNFLHHFDADGCEQLLRQAHAALVPDGRAVILDFVPDEDRVSPPTAAMFALAMLATTPSGDAYTFSDYDRMLRGAGFRQNELHQLAPSPQQVVVAWR